MTSEKVPPEEAAKDAVDPNRLLEGEDPTTPHPEEALHWIEVYSDLLTFKERALTTAQQALAETPESDARAEAERTDLPVLEAERERIRHRMAFWRERHRELSAE